MATIERRGPLQWRVRIRRKGLPVQTQTFESREDAYEWAQQVESKIKKGTLLSYLEAEQTVLAEAIERFERERLDSYAHPGKIKSRLAKIREHAIIDLPLAAIRGKDLADYIRDREAQGLSSQTILHEINLISRIFEICRKDWGMETLHNPAKNVSKPKLPKGRTRRLERDEEKRLLEACSPELRPVILFALETCMRRSEIVSLTWSNVDLKKRFAHLPETKNGEARTVPLSPAAIEILKTIPRDIGGRVFSLHPDTISKEFAKACREAGIADLRFHDLRHEGCSRLFENTDLDVMEIRVITGHKTLQMLARYSHLRTARLAERLAGTKKA